MNHHLTPLDGIMDHEDACRRRIHMALEEFAISTPTDVVEMTVVNQLPFSRRAVWRYDPSLDGSEDDEDEGEPPPAALIDDHGRRYPVQGIDEDTAWITSVELGPLEGRRLHRLDEPMAGSIAEIDTHLIDNGRTRAELDARGRLQRLCFDGVFAALPGLLPRFKATDEVRIDIVDAGPVQLRLSVTSPQEVVTYELHAQDDGLHLAISPTDPAHSATLPLPAFTTLVPRSGLDRWFRLPTATGEVVVVTALPCRDLVGTDDKRRIAPLQPATEMAVVLLDGLRHPDDGALVRRSLDLAVPLVPGLPTRTPPFRWWHLGDLVPAMITETSERLQLFCFNAGLRDGICWLYPLHQQRNCRLITDDGTVLGDAIRSKEGDGWEIRHRAGETLCLELER